MQDGGVSLGLTLILHEQAFGDYLTYHSFLSLESVGWRTSCGSLRSNKIHSFLIVKATSHSTIFDIPMRPLREDQRHRHRFTS